MKAILIDISFFEAHFKVHYTKTFRLSYPIPLPTSVAGIFGALFGIDRTEIKKELSDFYFGAKLLKNFNENFENFTFIQIPWNKKTWPPGIVYLQILCSPEYQLALAGEDNNKINQLYKKIKKNFVFLPYGGQNDFFVKDIKILGIYEVRENNFVENYAPRSMVEKTEILSEKNAFLVTLPVMHKFSPSEDPFYFSYKAKLFLKDKIPAVEGIGLYELFRFYYPNQ